MSHPLNEAKTADTAQPAAKSPEPNPALEGMIKPMISSALTECSIATNETLTTQRKLLDRLLEIESSMCYFRNMVELSAVYNTDVALNDCVKSAIAKAANLRERISKLSNYTGTIEARVIKISHVVLKELI